MQLTALYEAFFSWFTWMKSRAFTKTLIVMRLTAVLIVVGCLQASAGSFGQNVTVSGNKISLESVFKSIKQQTGYLVVYNSDLLLSAKPVSVSATDMPLSDFLRQALKGQPFDFQIEGKTIVLTSVTMPPNRTPERDGTSLFAVFPVSGVVHDAEGVPVSDVTVTIKGSKKSIATDRNGQFILNVNVGDVLVFSSIGFDAQSITIKDNTTSLVVSLKRVVKDLDEAMVVAYNTTTKRMNTGAVTVVKGETISSLPNRSIDRSLQGMVPGLLVTNGNGQPGGGLSNFVLRGIGTGTSAQFGSTVRNPLIVIDGVPVTQDYLQRASEQNSTPISNPMAQLNPSDIESISILKDASAIALYGTRASNGVILVTTKKGKAGSLRVEVKQQTDVSARVKSKIDMLNQDEYLQLLIESYKNLNSPSYPSEEAIMSDIRKKFPIIVNSPGDTSFYPTPNWLKELYNDRAITFSSDLSFSGGNEKNIYYLGLGYLSQKGIVKNTGYDRASIRYNTEQKPNSWFKFGVNTTFSYSKQNYSGLTENPNDQTGLGYILSPLNPIRTADGNYLLNYNAGTYFNLAMSNPAASLDYNISRILSYRQMGNAFVEVNILKNLKFRSSLGFDFMLSQVKDKVDPRLTLSTISSVAVGVGSVAEQDNRRTNLISTNTVQYQKIFYNKHNLNFILGQEAQQTVNKTLTASSQGLTVPYFQEVSNGTTNRVGGGFSTIESLLSFFGQANYGYDNKYFISASIRRDGSSKFGINERYGNYWSTGIGWVLSEEKFLKNTPWLNYFKLRGSIGTSGNAAALASAARFYQLNVINYAGNTTFQSSSIPGNEDIKWEETFNGDAGIESRFFNERISLSVDVYKRNVSNLIYPVLPAPVSGFGNTYPINFGKLENKGIEMALFFDVIRNRKFKWNVSVNWSKNGNKLLKANPALTTTGNLIIKEGQSFQSFYLVRWAGVDPSNGKPQWLDSVGNVTNTYNQANRVIVGKPQPDGFGGINTSFSYHNIEASVSFYYQYGYKIYDNAIATLVNDGSGSPYINQSKMALDTWKKAGDIATNPRRVLGNVDGGTNASTRYLYNGDYIRLKNILLSYSFPHVLLRNIKISSLKVYLQAYNLALWTKYKGIDPENIGVSGGGSFAYPQAGSFSLGFNLNF